MVKLGLNTLGVRDELPSHLDWYGRREHYNKLVNARLVRYLRLCVLEWVSVTDEKLLAYLYKNHHATPFEMAGMVIEVKAPIFVFREWHRHRTQSYNEMSARYVPLPDENYIPTFDRIAEGVANASGNRQAQGQAPLNYGGIAVFLKDLETAYGMVQGVYERALRDGVPKEIARLPLPVARYSQMRASANLRNWLAFLTLRMAPNAQWEIRQYANAVGRLVESQFPRTWKLFFEEA